MNTLSKDIEDVLVEHSSPAIMTPQLKGQKVILLEWGQLTPQLIGDLKELILEFVKEVIGENDVKLGENRGYSRTQRENRNKLRRQQRAKVKELLTKAEKRLKK